MSRQIRPLRIRNLAKFGDLVGRWHRATATQRDQLDLCCREQITQAPALAWRAQRSPQDLHGLTVPGLLAAALNGAVDLGWCEHQISLMTVTTFCSSMATNCLRPSGYSLTIWPG